VEVIGVDGTPRGWLAVRVCEREILEARLCRRFADVLRIAHRDAVIGVDMPIGLREQGLRRADLEAQSVLGPRARSVFPVPPRPVLEAPEYAVAVALSRQLLGMGISRQLYALRRKIAEVAAASGAGYRIVEVHPEVSFWALGGNQPLRHGKRSWNGLWERIELLRAAGFDLPRAISRAPSAAPHDFLDALAAAWSASRVAVGRARSLPDPPERDREGNAIAIWY